MAAAGDPDLHVTIARSAPDRLHHLRTAPRRRGICGHAAADLVAVDQVSWGDLPRSQRCPACDQSLRDTLESTSVPARRRRHDDRQRLLAALLRGLDEMDAINLIVRRSATRAEAVNEVMERLGFAEDETHHILAMPVWQQTREARRALEEELERHKQTRP